MSNFTVDFFELMFLAEVCIPPRPIARSMFWDDLSDKHYHAMSPDERKRAFDWLANKYDFNLDNADCSHFFARYNPENQYKLQLTDESEVSCYLFNGRYHISKNKTVSEGYIKEVEKV